MAQDDAEQPTSTSGTRSTRVEQRHDGENRGGRTSIADSVVQKIAAIAAREVSGVHTMGSGASRAFGALRERVSGGSGTSTSSGVRVEVGEKQAAVDLDVVVEYGVSIVELTRAVRRNVLDSVERMTGLEVIEVNIAVNDIRLPSEDSDTNESSRVE
ncbi:putative alkaline shock family protein YloU [Actinopolyspora biskrensis]|uniref:Putative alkaline shock family protein YloU n=1 Tax=Actinopolyspora biskrensis TaxID=1470178 RepID=A0A852Z7A6_9ACTN|nr:Asp23/Gls24 family envelope stress response protein [Actinopolyspora biskrensis]NYH79446.1 putative alkaline shock family protein YloU [Actinopolyspora biskrensis]